MNKWIFIIMAPLFFSCPVVELTNFINPAAIQKEIENANNGDTVFIPAGICIINTPIVFEKNINLIGAGIDKTIIMSNFSSFDTQPIKIIGNDNAGNPRFRISGMTFKSELPDSDGNFIYIAGNCKQFRIDHVKFEKGGAHSIMIDGDTSGLIDNCIFESDSQESISIRNTTAQDAVWTAAAPMPMSENEAVFIEDCTFNFVTKGTHAVTAVNGARFVFRRNTVKSKIDGALVDAHGKFENDRSNYSAEIYDNHLEDIGNSSFYIGYGIYIRGGRAVITDNQMFGNFSYPIVLTNYASWTNNYQYPQRATVVVNTVTYRPNLLIGEDAQSLTDGINNTYCWNNTLNGRKRVDTDMTVSNTEAINGAVSAIVLERGYDTNHIVLNTDYWNGVMGGYTKHGNHSLNAD